MPSWLLHIPYPALVPLPLLFMPGFTFRAAWGGKRRAGELRVIWPWWRRWF